MLCKNALARPSALMFLPVAVLILGQRRRATLCACPPLSVCLPARSGQHRQQQQQHQQSSASPCYSVRLPVPVLICPSVCLAVAVSVGNNNNNSIINQEDP